MLSGSASAAAKEVFDYVADERDEARFNTQMWDVELRDFENAVVAPC